ncbi:hypothetical protein A616_02270 [Brevibacillus brevis X23]|nr:hypothetical protein A616_02270 [Brevibacillus brevis X23]
MLSIEGRQGLTRNVMQVFSFCSKTVNDRCYLQVNNCFRKKETGDKTQRRQLQVGWALGRPMSTFSPIQRIVLFAAGCGRLRSSVHLQFGQMRRSFGEIVSIGLFFSQMAGFFKKGSLCRGKRERRVGQTSRNS